MELRAFTSVWFRNTLEHESMVVFFFFSALFTASGLHMLLVLVRVSYREGSVPTDFRGIRNRLTITRMKVGVRATLLYANPQHLIQLKEPTCTSLQPRVERILHSPNSSIGPQLFNCCPLLTQQTKLIVKCFLWHWTSQMKCVYGPGHRIGDLLLWAINQLVCGSPGFTSHWLGNEICVAQGDGPSLSRKHSIAQVHLFSPLLATSGQSIFPKKHLFLFSKSENHRRHSEGPI